MITQRILCALQCFHMCLLSTDIDYCSCEVQAFSAYYIYDCLPDMLVIFSFVESLNDEDNIFLCWCKSTDQGSAG